MTDDGPSHLDRCMAVYTEFCRRRDQGIAESEQQLLDAHPQCREVLAALLAPEPQAPLPDAAPPGFELLEYLDQGRFGRVYRARDVQLDRTVALKILPRGHDGLPHRAEAMRGAQLEHPGICRVLDFVRHGEQDCLVLEFIDGERLADRIAAAPRPPAGEALAGLLRTFVALAQALAFAHARGVVHRDLSPRNVMLRHRDGAPVVLDFGLAQGIGRDPGPDAAPVGTLAYAAPEQILGRPVDGQADVFALGAMLHECLTLARPFADATPQQAVQRATAAEPPPSPRLRNRAVSRDLALVVGTAMAQDPRRRYDAAAFATDLELVLAGRPPHARRAGWVYRLQRWVVRNPTATGALLLLAGLAGGVCVLAWQAQTARRHVETLLARQEFDLAERLASTGDWTTAIATYRLARARGYDAVPTLLGEAQCLEGMFEIGDARDVLLALDRRSDAAAWRGPIRLRLADRSRELMGLGPAQGLDEIRAAVALGLPPADLHYARAILAGTVVEARDALEQTLRLQGTHRAANEMYPALLALTGHVDAAMAAVRQFQRLYPADPVPRFQEAVFLACQGQLDAALALCAAHPDLQDKAGTALLRSHAGVHRVLERVFARMHLPALGAAGADALAQQSRDFEQLATHMLEALQGSMASSAMYPSFLRVPPAAVRLYAETLRQFVTLRSAAERTETWLGQQDPTHRDAAQWFVGAMAAALRKAPTTAAAFLAAARAPSLLFPLQRSSWFLSSASARLPQDAEILQQAIDGAAQHTDLTAAELRYLCRRAQALGAPRRDLLARWQRAEPGHPEPVLTLAELALACQQPAAARDHLAQAEALAGSHPEAEALRPRLAQLRQRLQ